MTRFKGLVALAPLVAAQACGGSQPPPPPSPAPPPPAPTASAAPAPAPSAPKREQVPTTLAAVGLDGTAIDSSVSPCEDFYQYACGGWEKKTEIPADKSRWSRSFSTIDERNEADLRQILEDAAKEAKEPGVRKLGEFYRACMDEKAVDKRKLAPIEGMLARAKAVRDPKSITALVAELHRHKIWALFDVSAEQDFKDATRYLTYLDQNGLGLPDRDYYLKDDDKSNQLRELYLGHVERMLKLSGMKGDEAKQAATEVMDLETELAKVSKTRVERRDPQALYNKLDRPALDQLSPKVDWSAYFKAIGLPAIADVNVTHKPYFEGVSRLLESVPADKWRRYLAWHIVHHSAKLLGKAFVDEDFKLEQALTGQKEQRARWKRCIDFTDESLGELLAQPFVKLRFGPESKTAAERLIAAIGDAFVADVGSLPWMNASTAELARAKHGAMAFLIGYPERWKTYDFPIEKADFAKNALRGRAFDQARKLSRIGKPVDRGEWEMTPPTVNAYYNPLKNQMVFPAGILQPPFYDVKAAIPVNLGAMGMVVGHELTHGFDDEGSQFDKDGNMRDWWPPEVKQRFTKQTACVAEQYSKFEAVPGVKLSGKLTLGENIADMGGVKLAFHAYRALTRGTPEHVADGMSEDQQFFLSVGQIWCTKQREEWARMMAQIDPHSPPRWRVNGSLQNLPEFAEAFSCKPKTVMSPEKRCSVW